MIYGSEELLKIIDEASKWLKQEIIVQNSFGGTNAFLESIGCNLRLEEDSFLGNDPKVLVVGDVNGKKQDLQLLIKREFGESPDDFEFIGYDAVAKLGIGKLENSTKYSDIFVGPIPHSVKDLGDYNSLLSKLEDLPEQYPRVHVLKTRSSGQKLKITKSNFREAIKNSVYCKIRGCQSA
jgi:hypothetical protein